MPSLSIIRVGENKASIAYSRSIMSKAGAKLMVLEYM